MLRSTSSEGLTFWLACSEAPSWSLCVRGKNGTLIDRELASSEVYSVQLGKHLHIVLLRVAAQDPLPTDEWLVYELSFKTGDAWQSIAETQPFLRLENDSLTGSGTGFRFRIPSQIRGIFHGSCRKPHHPSRDGLARADQWIEQHLDDERHWPDLLLLTGDQMYADDVSGPLLVACHRLAERLGIFDEPLPDTQIQTLEDLVNDPRCYYHRSDLLPDSPEYAKVDKRFFEGKRKPIFTTDSAENHLITFSEVICAYLLVWSPTPWTLIKVQKPNLDASSAERFDKEWHAVRGFVESLDQVARVFAHIPTYMIWDDHDVTDDWNLSAAWELAAYQNPLSKRIIGNAMLGYLLCQGLANDPERMLNQFGDAIQTWAKKPTPDQHQELVTELIRFNQWSYAIPIEPGILVLDTRTQRWRSQSSPAEPSGLMDWEALIELQQNLMDKPVVILVSPAPIFGVKLIEAIQRIFTWIGKPLLVDAENWMAHPGSANVILNIFRHSRTPERFIILSGDVHYSFVYDVDIRFRDSGPRIHQITSSGLKNEFPEKLLNVLDRVNRWLYAPWSPLNWFTKRRLMRVRPRKPEHSSAGERLVNGSGIGWLGLDEQFAPTEILQITSEGRTVRFDPSKEDEHWS